MARILIVGAGIVGLSVARSAIRAGHEVTILEQGPVPNPRAASVDRHRMIRYPYGSAVGYTRMVTDAFGAWDRLWQDLGAAHFEDVGSIAISLEPGDYAEKTLATFREIGLSHEVLDREGIERLCPHLTLPAGSWGVVARPGGPLFADRIVADLSDWLRRRGARIETGVRAETIDFDQGTVTREDGEVFSGDFVLVAAGAWLPKLLRERYGAAPVYRQALVYVQPPEAFVESWREAPAIAALGDHTGYTLPDRRGTGLKIGYSAHRRPADPDLEGFGADLDTESRAILAAFAPYFRDAADYRPLRMQVGYYVLDASRRFRLDRIGRGLVVTNCDGQMFKFGPLLGERILGMVDGAETPDALARWAAGH